MKKISNIAALVVAVALSAAAAKPVRTVVDDFSDGVPDGWGLGYSQPAPWTPGNWRIDNGVFINDAQGDGYVTLAEGPSSPRLGGGRRETQRPRGLWRRVIWYTGRSALGGHHALPRRWQCLGLRAARRHIYRLTYHPLILSHDTWYRLVVNANADTAARGLDR